MGDISRKSGSDGHAKAIKLLLVDDHQVVRDGMRSAFDGQATVAVVGEAADGQAAERLARELSPDVVLMDVNMPVLNGIEATRAIAAAGLRARVLVLSSRCDKHVVAEAMRAGAAGYVSKESSFRELLSAVFTVASGRTYLSPAAADAVVEGYVRHSPDSPTSAFDNLTPKGRQVLQLVAEGRSTKEIAAELGISAKTVDTHRQDIMARLNLHSVAELTKYAIREGLTSA